jgi:hypothetical protein
MRDFEVGNNSRVLRRELKLMVMTGDILFIRKEADLNIWSTFSAMSDGYTSAGCCAAKPTLSCSQTDSNTKHEVEFDANEYVGKL